MKYYRNIKTNLIHAFESDGSHDDLITNGFIRLFKIEEDQLINSQNYLSDEEKEAI